MRHKREHKDDDCDIDDKREHEKIIESEHKVYMVVRLRS